MEWNYFFGSYQYLWDWFFPVARSASLSGSDRFAAGRIGIRFTLATVASRLTGIIQLDLL